MKFTKKRIEKLLNKVGSRLLKRGTLGEVGIVDGAAMVLAYDTRTSTKDIDAIFKPSDTIRKVVREIASEEDLPEDWLNDGVKGFLPGNPKNKTILMDIPGLRVWTPEPEYMLAMKAFSARIDTKDADDLKLLIRILKLQSAKSVFSIIQKYYPDHTIPAKTQFFVEEIFDQEI